MKTVADAATLAALIQRLERVVPDQSRVWGTMSAHQMVVHLGDGAEAVLGRRPFSARQGRGNRFIKWGALHLPVRWPHGVRAGANPAGRVLDVAEFAAHRDRAIRTLRELAAARADGLVPGHPLFGTMSRADWRRWAFLHTDHHLRQFGL
jgi:DinB superfamily